MKTFPTLFLAFSAMLLPAAAQDIRAGLVSYWPLDEVSVDGLTTPDKAPLHTDLTLVNMSSANVVPGMRGNGMSFNGVSQLMFADTSTGANPGLPLQKNVRKTICLWVKGNGSAQQDKRFFSEASMASTSPMFNMSTDSAASGRTGKLDIYIRSDAGAATVNHAKSVGEPLNDQWHHVALTDDNGVVRYYVDGVQDTATLTYTRPVMTLTTLSLGAIQRLNGAVAFFNGTLDDVAVWNRILTPAEIQQVKDNGLVTPVPPIATVNRPGPHLQGDRLQFTVDVKGVEVTSSQWRRNGTDIPGATESTYVIPAVTSAQQGEYTVLINGSLVSTPVTIAVTADPVPSLSTNIVSWWPFESLDVNAIPATTPDPWGGHPLSGTDLDLTSLVPGKFGTGLEFDGLTKMAYRTTGFPIAGNPEYTVAFWVKADGTTQADLRVFAEGSDTTNTPLFAMGTAADGSNHLRMYVRSDSNAIPVALDSQSAVLDDTWHHVVWTDRNGQARLYVDGVLDATNYTYNRTALTFTLNQTSIGGIKRLAPSHWCRSTMDDVAVWNRALTWTEIQALMSTGVPAPVSAVAPDVTVQPVSRTLWAGRAASLSIQATGTAPFTYQWKRNGDPVPTGTGATLLLDPAQAADSGSYVCTVTNSAGSDTSSPATLLVRPITHLDTGRLSAWALDAGDPTTPDSLSGHDLSLTNFAPELPWQAGIKNNAARFDGVDDFLVHPWSGTGTDSTLSTREEFTIAFWARGSANGQLDRRVIAEASVINTNPLFNLGTDIAGATDKLNVFIRSDTGAVPVNHLASNAAVFDGFWHHVIYTDYRGQMQLFVDGLPDATVTYARPASTLSNFSIGAIARAAPSHWFNGSVDEVNTWERALSTDEAAALYLSQPKPEPTLDITGMTVTPEGLIQLTVSTSYGNAEYRLQTSNELKTGTWTDETNAVIGPVSFGTLTIDLSATVAGRRFYRVYIP